MSMWSLMVRRVNIIVYIFKGSVNVAFGVFCNSIVSNGLNCDSQKKRSSVLIGCKITMRSCVTCDIILAR